MRRIRHPKKITAAYARRNFDKLADQWCDLLDLMENRRPFYASWWAAASLAVYLTHAQQIAGGSPVEVAESMEAARDPLFLELCSLIEPDDIPDMLCSMLI